MTTDHIRHAGAALPMVVTMGDCCGIGPEIAAEAVGRHASEGWPAVVVGDAAVMARAAALRGLRSEAIPRLEEARRLAPGVVAVLQPPGLPASLSALPDGHVSAAAGAAAVTCIEHAVAMVKAGQGVGIVTAPIHKEALQASGSPFPGHTEMLQALGASPGAEPLPVRMMLANDELRVVLVTIHVSVRRALDLITVDRVLDTVRMTDAAGRRAGLDRPRIAVAGLNPHAGEGGLFGDEDMAVIAPAVRAAVAEGIDASGPFAPDTIFMRARSTPARPGEFDYVVAMLHDHGLIPVKYLGVEQGVNVTLGLPFVRTSPDHGTAFDIAWQGTAGADSMVAAMKMAWTLAGRARP